MLRIRNADLENKNSSYLNVQVSVRVWIQWGIIQKQRFLWRRLEEESTKWKLNGLKQKKKQHPTHTPKQNKTERKESNPKRCFEDTQVIFLLSFGLLIAGLPWPPPPTQI